MIYDIRNHLVAAEFTAAIESGDPVAIRAMLAPDATVWYAYRGPEGQLMSGEEAIATIAGMRTNVREFKYIQARRVLTERGYLQISLIRAVSKRGTVIQVPLALEAEVNAEGKLTSYREWLDIKHLAPFLAEGGGNA